MRKKIIYLISWNYTPHNGVVNKIFDQLNIWNKDSEIILIWLEGSRKKIVFEHNINFKFYIFNVRYNFLQYNNIINLVNDINPDFIYVRYPFFHPLLYLICNNKKTILEINTLEKREMLINLKNNKNPKFFLNFLIFILSRKKYLKSAKLLFFVTNELMNHPDYFIYKKKYFIPNSINLNSRLDIKRVNLSGRINLLFIGTEGHIWHGIDKLLKLAEQTLMYDYHIVGINGISNKNIFYYGKQDSTQIYDLMKKINICIGSLSMSSLGLTEACPLKTREYIASGFPIVIGYNDSAFLNEDILPFWVHKINIDDFKLNNFTMFCEKYRNYIIDISDKKNFVSSYKFEKNRIDLINEI
jgi:hypothetical protein